MKRPTYSWNMLQLLLACSTFIASVLKFALLNLHETYFLKLYGYFGLLCSSGLFLYWIILLWVVLDYIAVNYFELYCCGLLQSSISVGMKYNITHDGYCAVPRWYTQITRSSRYIEMWNCFKSWFVGSKLWCWRRMRHLCCVLLVVSLHWGDVLVHINGNYSVITAIRRTMFVWCNSGLTYFPTH